MSAPASAQGRVMALALAAAFTLVPANLLPVMEVTVLGRGSPSTIYSGVVSLWHEGMWGIAVIVLVASFLVPMVKLGGLVLLLLAANGRWPRRRRALTRLYQFIAGVGRWSMLDVFLVVFLAGLVQLGGIASIVPGPGIVAFAAAVILTILATDAFDPRWLWAEGDAALDARQA